MAWWICDGSFEEHHIRSVALPPLGRVTVDLTGKRCDKRFSAFLAILKTLMF